MVSGEELIKREREREGEKGRSGFIIMTMTRKNEKGLSNFDLELGLRITGLSKGPGAKSERR